MSETICYHFHDTLELQLHQRFDLDDTVFHVLDKTPDSDVIAQLNEGEVPPNPSLVTPPEYASV
jgi:hypothetical protein